MRHKKLPHFNYIIFGLFFIVLILSSLPSCTNLRQGHKDKLRLALGGTVSCSYNLTEVWCWGWNYYSALGVPRAQISQTSKPIKWKKTFERIERVSLGLHHGCLIDKGQVYCWGLNRHGQASAYPGAAVIEHPQVIRLPDLALSVSAKGSHSCALLRSRDVYCWGKNFYGQTGQAPSQRASLEPQKVPGLPKTIIGLAIQYQHSCAWTEGDLYCWGWNEMGQLGHESDRYQVHKVALPPGKLQQVSLGSFHTCAVVDYKAYCWGRNDLGQLGLPEKRDYKKPTLVTGSDRVLSLYSGYKHTCYVNQKQLLQCAGWNLGQQLGYKTVKKHSFVFRPVDFEHKRIDKIIMGFVHGCFRRDDRFFCWGGNRMGLLGLDNINMSLEPVELKL